MVDESKITEDIDISHSDFAETQSAETMRKFKREQMLKANGMVQSYEHSDLK